MTSDTMARHAKVDGAKLLEDVLIRGDLSKLNEAERMFYYSHVCESVGLNPLTRPFDYITFPGGKMELYCKKSGKEQLRARHGVSIYKLERTLQADEMYTVTAYARDNKGREDVDEGIVDLTGLKGLARANAKKKAITQAKGRVTLSICGLGMVDESELDDIPGATLPHAAISETGEVTGGQAQVDEREALLISIRELGDSLGLKAKERMELWVEHVGQPAESAPMEKLQALKAALVAREKKP